MESGDSDQCGVEVLPVALDLKEKRRKENECKLNFH